MKYKYILNHYSQCSPTEIHIHQMNVTEYTSTKWMSQRYACKVDV
jgi:hypothetical protein